MMVMVMRRVRGKVNGVMVNLKDREIMFLVIQRMVIRLTKKARRVVLLRLKRLALKGLKKIGIKRKVAKSKKLIVLSKYCLSLLVLLILI